MVAMESTSAEIPSELVDLTKIRLADLQDHGDSAPVRSMRRVLEDIVRQQDIVAGFSSAI
jgi:hypothetical protein